MTRKLSPADRARLESRVDDILQSIAEATGAPVLEVAKCAKAWCLETLNDHP